MEETKALLESLIGEMKSNTSEVTELRVSQQQALRENVALRASNRRERRWRRITVTVAILAVAAILITNQVRANHEHKISANQAKDLQCIAGYENANRARSALLTSLSTARNKALRNAEDALHALTSAALRKTRPSEAQGRVLVANLDKAQAAYAATDDAYNAAVQNNPLPDPVFQCSSRLPAPKKTAARRPGVPTPPAATVTRTAHATRTIAVPQPARTFVLPGATVFRTSYATVTVAPGHRK